MKTPLTSTRLNGPSLPHKLRESRTYSVIIFSLVGIVWGIAWFIVASNNGSLPRWFTNFVLTSLGVSATYWCVISFFVKEFPKDHALVDDDGDILFDVCRANIALWRWDYKGLTRKGRFIRYELKVHNISVRAEMRQYRILFLTGCSMEETRQLEKTIKELTMMDLRTAEDIVKVNFYDVLRDYPQVIADLKNPLRTEEQETFQKLLLDHLLTRLTGMGIKVIPQSAKFSWA